jgi:hypothetical protein
VIATTGKVTARVSILSATAALLLLGLLLTGCEEKPSVAPPEARIKALTAFVRRSGNARRFELLFVEGAAPDDSLRPVYAKYSYQATDVKVDDDTATATVLIRKSGSVTQEVLAEAEWEYANVDSTWKVKTAPLPQELVRRARP